MRPGVDPHRVAPRRTPKAGVAGSNPAGGTLDLRFCREIVRRARFPGEMGTPWERNLAACQGWP